MIVAAFAAQSAGSLVELPDAIAYPPTAQAAQVTVTAPPAGAVLKAVVRCRHEYDRSYALPAQGAAAASALALPAVPAGEYLLDAWLADAEGKVLDGADAFGPEHWKPLPGPAKDIQAEKNPVVGFIEFTAHHC